MTVSDDFVSLDGCEHATLSHKKILYVEDHEDTRFLVMTLLELHGYEVAAVATVAEALSLVRRSIYDLCLIDIRLPDGSGIDLCREIRTLNYHTPILFLSANEIDKRDVAAAGAQGLMLKPADFCRLEETIHHLIATCPFGRQSQI